jgi:mannitol-specific phosphotransferase system IIBC component
MSSKSHAALRYTSLRLAVFLACFLVVWLLALVRVIPVAGSLGVVFLLALAAVLSAPISYVVLSKQRDAMSEQIVSRVERTKRKLAENRSQEDAADEQARSSASPPEPQGS